MFPEIKQALRKLQDSSCVLMTLGVFLASSPPAAAQEFRPERPYRGLFGGGAGGPLQGQSLELTWTVAGANDDNNPGGSSNPTSGMSQINEFYGMGGAQLAYIARGESIAFSATGGSTGRYYRNYNELSGFDAVGGVSVSAALGRRVRLNAFQNFQYSPYYQLDFLPSYVPANRDGHSAADPIALRDSRDYEGELEIQTKVGSRSSITADYGYRDTRFGADDETFNWRMGRLRFMHGLSKYASLRLGYGYGTSTNTFAGLGDALHDHTIEVGVDYQRALSLSRRTSVTFFTGSTSFVQEDARHLYVTGEARLTREIGRSWDADVSYNRGVQYVAGFARPLLADTVQGGVAGLLSRRVTLKFQAGYAAGTVGIGVDNYSTMHAQSELRIALSQLFSFDARYGYYDYTFDDTVRLPIGLPRHLGRHGVSVGLTGWLPLFR